MVGYLLRRILALGPVLLAVALITFLLMHAVPGGPWDSEKPLDPVTVAALNQKYGLDQPLWRQFLLFLANALRGDLGVSYMNQGRPVTDILADGFLTTATLGLISMALALAIGLALGVAAALRRNSVLDRAASIVSACAASTPTFVLGAFLVALFSVRLHWLPSGGWGSLQQMVMPVAVLAALPAAYIARVTRASMLEVLDEEYIRTARSKGLREQTILFRHTIRNGLIPIITVIGPIAAALVTGSFIVESFFSIPGIGRLFVQGVFARDYGLIMGATLFYALIVAVANLAVDLLYAVVDPRIRYE
jgi:oligopeptide transport system permease protein